MKFNRAVIADVKQRAASVRGLSRIKYATATASGTLALDAVDGLVETDAAEKSATFIVSTRSRDRQGDIMEPEGCLPSLSNYRKNPIWCYNHQHEADGKPIGLSMDALGRFTVVVKPDVVKATCHFHCLTTTSRDVWELVRAGVLRASSVGFLPIQADKLGSKSYHFREWDLTEISVVAIPANAEALREEMKHLTSPLVRKSLAEFARRGGVCLNGSKLKQGRTFLMALTSEELQRRKAMKKPEDDEEEEDEETSDDASTDTLPDEEEKEVDEPSDLEGDDNPDEPSELEEDAETPEEETAEDDGEEVAETGALPPGAQTLADLCGHFAGLAEYCRSVMAGNEHPTVRARLELLAENADAVQEELKGEFAETYPDFDIDAAMADAGGDDEIPPEDEFDDEDDGLGDEPVLKSKGVRSMIVKRLKSVHRQCVKEAGEYLTDLAEDEKMLPRHKAGCRYHAKALGEMMSAYDKPEEATEEKEEDEDMEKSLQSLSAKLKQATKAFGGKV